jgi:hypothetical protein
VDTEGRFGALHWMITRPPLPLAGLQEPVCTPLIVGSLRKVLAAVSFEIIYVAAQTAAGWRPEGP